MALIVSAVLLFNPMSKEAFTPTAYSAVLESDSNEPMAYTKIRKSDMKLSIDIMKPVHISDDMELTLWCHPKGGGMPMKMGVISKTGKTDIKISKKEWQNMKDVGVLAISVEHKGDNTVREPTGKILLKGQLNTAG
jgi:anti-sigma-K factor RskA